MIVGVQATAARMSQETVAAQSMLTRFSSWQGRTPESVAADTTYGNGEFLQWLQDRDITPYMRTRDSIHRKRSPYLVPSVSRTNRNTTAISAPQASRSIMADACIEIAPSTTSGPAKSVESTILIRPNLLIFFNFHHPKQDYNSRSPGGGEM